MPLERAVLIALRLLNSSIIDQDQHKMDKSYLLINKSRHFRLFQLKSTPFKGVQQHLLRACSLSELMIFMTLQGYRVHVFAQRELQCDEVLLAYR